MSGKHLHKMPSTYNKHSLSGNSMIMLEGRVMTSGWDSRPIILTQGVNVCSQLCSLSWTTYSVSSLRPMVLATGD